MSVHMLLPCCSSPFFCCLDPPLITIRLHTPTYINITSSLFPPSAVQQRSLVLPFQQIYVGHLIFFKHVCLEIKAPPRHFFPSIIKPPKSQQSVQSLSVLVTDQHGASTIILIRILMMNPLYLGRGFCYEMALCPRRLGGRLRCDCLFQSHKRRCLYNLMEQIQRISHSALLCVVVVFKLCLASHLQSAAPADNCVWRS